MQENEYITLVFYMFVIKRNLSYLLVTSLSKVQYFPQILFDSTGLLQMQKIIKYPGRRLHQRKTTEYQ